MAFRVDITEKALSDVQEIFVWLEEQSGERAAQWLNETTEAVYSLEEFPNRCALAPEGKAFSLPIRQLLCGKRGSQYRILFEVCEDTVFVLRIRHASSQTLEEEEIN